MNNEFFSWLDSVLSDPEAQDHVAFNFNIYEEVDEFDDDEADDSDETVGSFSLQLIGASRYDPDDDDWACDEEYSSGENLFAFSCDDWEAAIELVKDMITDYMANGNHKSVLNSATAVGYGFVDGDLFII